MPCVKLRRVMGTVAGMTDGKPFAVRLADGTSLNARISRRLALLQKRYAVGDQVQVGMLLHRRGDSLILTGGPGAARAAAQPS